MSRTAHGDRIWIGGGAVGALLLAILAWMFLISPQNADTTALDEQAVGERAHVSSLRQRLSELQGQNLKFASYESELNKDLAALPPTPEFSAFLGELQAGGAASAVTIDSVTASAPTPAATGAAKLYSVPLTLTATGSGLNIQRFLNQLQQVRPRATLISAVNLAAEGQAGSVAGSSSVNITMHVFTTMQGEKKTG